MLNRFILAFLLSLMTTFGVAAMGYTVDQIPNVHVSDSTKFVSNPDGILSPETVASLNANIRRVWNQTSTEFVVVVVDQIDSDYIDGFATELFSKWKIGKRDNDNGVLFLVVKDMRRAVIRTGYGTEGVLPDIICGQILRNDVFPYFKEGNYNQGVIAGVDQIDKILSNPEYAAELKSKYANNAREDAEEMDFWTFMLCYLGFFILLSLFLYLIIYSIYSKHKDMPSQSYSSLKKMVMPTLVVTALGFGTPYWVYARLKSMMNKVRNTPRNCPNCNTVMHKLDEESDNAYLNTAQDMEEQLNSVDYDVWLCPKCGETDIIPFVNEESQYEKCPKCGAKTCSPVSDRIVVRPTSTRPGKGIITYYCQHCRTYFNKEYNVPPTGADNAAAAAAAGALLGGALGRNSGGFGGFGGGSFGGGRTGGGGASGGW